MSDNKRRIRSNGMVPQMYRYPIYRRDIIFPSRDDEGNDAGTLFGQNPKGRDLTFPVIR